VIHLNEKRMITRTHCIVCNTPLNTQVFDTSNEIYVAHYAIEQKSSDTESVPYTICVCETCNTPQLKYLGSPNEIYKLNHADSTGTLMNALHQNTNKQLTSIKDNIKGIVEIGSAFGVLADIILKDFDTPYTIIEPCYKGSIGNKTIIPSFFESVDPVSITANTLIISHVFEHFYKPAEILNKINQLPNLEYFILVFPDLEYYINNNILHVLNTEHTFYVDNDFLKKWVESIGFNCISESSFQNHSITFIFKKTNTVRTQFSEKNKNYDLDTYFADINQTVQIFNTTIEANPTSEIYLWPASIHTLTLLNIGQLNTTTITALADNSSTKINKYMYGYNLPIVSFEDLILQDTSNRILLLHGGVFNTEIKRKLEGLKNTRYVFGI
jgi:hypothetical protein